MFLIGIQKKIKVAFYWFGRLGGSDWTFYNRSPLAGPDSLPGPRVQFDSCHFSGAQQILLPFGFSLYTGQMLAISFSCFKHYTGL